MGKRKQPNERVLTPGSQYDQIYQFILTHPGLTSYDIAKELQPISGLSSEEISKRCSSLSMRGFLKKKLLTKKASGGRYITETYWYTTSKAPEDTVNAGMENHLWRPEESESIQKRYEINCFKVEALMKKFNRRVFKGGEQGSARDLAKHDLKLIDDIYDTVYQIDVDMTVRLTYYPVLGTLEDEYEFVFECYFMTKKIGHLQKVKYDPDKIMFWFHYNNKIIGIKFNSVQYASGKWHKLEKILNRRYKQKLKEDLFELNDLDDLLDDSR